MLKNLSAIGKGIYCLSKGDTRNQLFGLCLALSEDDYEDLDKSETLELLNLKLFATDERKEVKDAYTDAITNGLLQKCCDLAYLPFMFDTEYLTKNNEDSKGYLEDILNTREFDYSKAYLFCKYLYTVADGSPELNKLLTTVVDYTTSIEIGCLRDLEYLYAVLFVTPANRETLERFVSRVE